MKRRIVKLFHGKKAVSVWRITFVKAGCRGLIGSVPFDQISITYFCFGTCLPDALNKLKFVSRCKWEYFCFERFTELDYNLIYEL